MLLLGSVARATNRHTNKHKLVTHNLGDISKVSVQVRVVLPVLVHVVTHSYLAHLPYL